MIAVLTLPAFLKFPLGGAQQSLDRVKRASIGGALGGGGQVGAALGTGRRAAVQTLGLKSTLYAWWALDEASGNRADSHTNGYALTDNNTVTSNTGVGGAGTAAQFTEANGESLSRANIDVTSGSWTWAGFVYLNSKDSWRTLVSQNDGAVDQFVLRYAHPAVGDFFRWNFNNATLHATNFGAASLNTWYFVRAWVNSADNTINLRINETAETPVGPVAPVGTGAAPFRIGAISNAGGVQFMDGRMAKWGMWNAVLSDADGLALYNGGIGRTYSEL